MSYNVYQKIRLFGGGNYFDLPPTRCIVCWDKVQPWENFSQWEMAWTSFDKPAIMLRISNTGGNNLDIKIHPTQKPVKLYSDLMHRLGIEPGTKILDTHGGSFSSAIAAYYRKCEFVGCEINEEYYLQALSRYNMATKQIGLFD